MVTLTSMVTLTRMIPRRTALGSKVAMFLLVCEIIGQYFPVQLSRYLESCTQRLAELFYPYIQITIHEFTGSYLTSNDTYKYIKEYLSDNSAKNAKRLKGEVRDNSNKLVLSMDDDEQVVDEFNGATVWWLSSKVESKSQKDSYNRKQEKRYYRLMFHKKHREMITKTYLEHVLGKGKEIMRQSKSRKLYSNYHKKEYWSDIVFHHPSTFDTLAMEPDKKQEIIEDLLTFSRSKDYYAKIGKAWKRGYLLYGPPGTGKSTMIAAMANLMGYDIYDLELAAVKNNSALRSLLVKTKSKSIIVIEDIDCSLELTGQRKKKEKTSSDSDEKKNEGDEETEDKSQVTLSGLLNCIDGLWSSSKEEQIIVFTTNHVNKLDPALTRRGRMDKHVKMSYCSFEGFKVLAKNYLQVEAHPTFDLIRRLMAETNITPADVAENLMPKTTTEDADACFSNLIQVLERGKRKKKLEKAEAMLPDTTETSKDPTKVDDMLPNKQEATITL